VNLVGSVVVVTGGTAGVGRAVTRAFAAEGARLGIIARDVARLEATAAELRSEGAEVCIASADVADANAIEQAATQIEETLGPIAVWVNNAMTSVFAPFTEVTPDEFRRVTEVTYLGYVYGTRTALSRMVPRDRGTVIQVGSALSERGIPLQAAYCGAKHGIQGFTESVRCELLHERSRVRIGIVQLPALNTPHFDWALSRLPRRAQPVPPIYQPEVAARAVVEFARRRRRELWVGWGTIRAMAANRVAPGLLDRYLARKGYDAQQTDAPERPERPNNLWAAVSGDAAAHGRFDERATRSTAALWCSLHRAPLIAAAVTLTVAVVLLVLL
jgi:short-subunit dehydrogenase